MRAICTHYVVSASKMFSQESVINLVECGGWHLNGTWEQFYEDWATFSLTSWYRRLANCCRTNDNLGAVRHNAEGMAEREIFSHSFTAGWHIAVCPEHCQRRWISSLETRNTYDSSWVADLGLGDPKAMGYITPNAWCRLQWPSNELTKLQAFDTQYEGDGTNFDDLNDLYGP